MAEGGFVEPERKLAAILAADVVGFSRMMGMDERGTLQRLHEAQRLVIDPILATHRGRVFKVMGDGMLAEFPSVVQALRAAVAIQAGLADRNKDLPHGARIVMRIGLHQGDVMVQGTDLLGDGVNVAARLEPLAAPGGICISARVREDALGKVGLVVADGGERILKNIARPVRVYFVRMGQGADGGDRTRPGVPAPLSEAAQPGDVTLVATLANATYALVVVQTAPHGPPADHVVSLANLPLTFGRQAPSDVLLPGGEVSRAHCRIERLGRTAVIIDLGSTNGTFLDGRRIDAAAELHPGCAVRIGPYTLRYVIVTPEPGAAVRAANPAARGP